MASSQLLYLDYDKLMQDAFAGGCFKSERHLAEASDVHSQTLRKIRDGKSVRESIARAIESAINDARRNRNVGGVERFSEVAWRSWLRGSPSKTQNLELRNARGIWRLEAQDVEVQGEFQYAFGPRQLEMEFVVTQEGRNLWATGRDGDGDPVTAWNAEFSEDWMYVSGRHSIRNDRVFLHGVFFLEYLNRGDRMLGYYLQTETDHRCRIVLGKISMALVESHEQPKS